MIKNPFRKIEHSDIAESQLREAKVNELIHEAAAEDHMAMARMYRERIARLNNVVSVPQAKAQG